MPDLLAHALLAYTIGLLLSWRYGWITAQYRTVCMAGAFIPDLSKVELLVPDEWVEQVLGVPFEWFGLHTGGAVLLSILVGVTVVSEPERKRVFALLAVGAGSHLVADGFLRTVTGYSYPIFWPITRYQPPTPGLYLSTDPTPTIIAILLALAAWVMTRYVLQVQTDTQSTERK